MKFVQRSLGDAAENNSGGNTRSQLREICVLGFLAVTAVAGLYLIVALLADTVLIRLSPERESQLFAFYSDQYTQSEIPVTLTDEWETAERIFTELLAEADLTGPNFALGYMKMKEPNAFAVPGGAIVLTRGLLESVKSEIGLAFVIAHELGHFANRDHLRGLGRQMGFKVVLALLFGADTGLTGNAADLILLNHSREREAAADDYALVLLNQHYDSTDGAGELFEILQSTHELPPWAYMFTSHPDNLERLKRINKSTQ